MNENISDIIRKFLNTATQEEIEEFMTLMEKKKKKSSNINNIAVTTAAEINAQLTITDDIVKKTARNVVATLAKQYKPDFTDREIESIVNELVPDKRVTVAPPPELLITMVRHFLDYSKGKISESELKDYPVGWQKKYWNSFSPNLRQMIADHLKGNTGESEFWRKLNRMIKEDISFK
ncbi:MAG TPA: hypothetical protein PK926_02490 [Spirochaetota bacterium]|nr:hypothetical protein [Spirochaetota bacterium]HPI88379.1 hypothetical protein [Spirochaetota bacterium]HPR46763.1 hypothetical protein [Spirochaetota bacterium]